MMRKPVLRLLPAAAIYYVSDIGEGSSTNHTGFIQTRYQGPRDSMTGGNRHFQLRRFALAVAAKSIASKDTLTHESHSTEMQ